MAEAAITRRWLKAVKPPERGSAVYWDSTKGAEGFGVRVLPSGRISYLARFWTGERVAKGTGKGKNRPSGERWKTLGAYPALDLDAARGKARELVTAARGAGRGARRDPIEEQRAAERERQRAAEERRLAELQALGETVASHVARWLEYLPTHLAGSSTNTRPISPATLAQYTALCRRFIVPLLGPLPVGAVHPDDVRKMHKSIRAKYQANRTVAVLSAFYSWLADEDGGRVVPSTFNPARRLKRLNPEQKRGATAAVRLSEAQEARLVRAILDEIEGDDPVGGTALLLLLDSGRRKGDVIGRKSDLHGMRWTRLDLKAGCYDLGRSKGKAADSFFIPPRCCAAIAKLPRIVGNDNVFTGDAAGGRRADLVSVWRRVKKAAGLESISEDLQGFHIHDLRHNRITKMLSDGMPPALVIRQVGHTSYKMLGRYTHPDLDKAAAAMLALPVIEPAPRAQVVAFG